MLHFADMAILDVWYYHIEAETVLKVFDKYAKKSAKDARKTVGKAESRTTGNTLEKLTEVIDGKRQFINTPPLVQRLSDLLTEEQKQQVTAQDVDRFWSAYVDSLPEERRLLLERFRITDAALRVGGVGSVGTRCTITLLEGDTDHDAIILQQKEAGPSALTAFLPEREYTSQSQRVVIGQRAMQAASDIFLGWNSATTSGRQYYWRQLKDMKGSFDVSKLDKSGLGTYLGVCAACLARAHARTGDGAWISGYLGSDTVFDEAIGDFAVDYADQAERDYQALVAAVAAGKITVQTGI